MKRLFTLLVLASVITPALAIDDTNLVPAIYDTKTALTSQPQFIQQKKEELEELKKNLSTVVKELKAQGVSIEELNTPPPGYFTLPKEEAKVEPFGEKHPLFVWPWKKAKSAAIETGKITGINKLKLGVAATKVGKTADDGFVVFGERTKKWHPALQTVALVSQIVLPWLIGFLK